MRAGVADTSVQVVPDKSEFCCNPKLVDGTVQEMTRPPAEVVMLNHGAGMECEMKTPPPLTVATHLPPSAEEATELHFTVGATFSVQVAPESAEVKIAPPFPNAAIPPAFTKRVPSAEAAT